MRDDTRKAYELLNRNGCTCVLCKGDISYCSRVRGVKPLLEYLDGPVDFSGYSAADKIVGKAAAYLYVLLGVEEIHAGVMTHAAASTLAKYGIKSFCDTDVETIYNRTCTGMCPMEEAVQDAASPEDACQKIRQKLALLQQQSKVFVK